MKTKPDLSKIVVLDMDGISLLPLMRTAPYLCACALVFGSGEPFSSSHLSSLELAPKIQCSRRLSSLSPWHTHPIIPPFNHTPPSADRNPLHDHPGRLLLLRLIDLDV